jgi:serine/threonine protein phosphatase PrpC
VKERLASQDAALFGVFDGHGQEGKAVSHHICATLPRLVSRSALCRVRRLCRGGTGPERRAQEPLHKLRQQGHHPAIAWRLAWTRASLARRSGPVHPRPPLFAPPPTLQPLTLESCLSACFVEANRSLRRAPTIDCDLSGSTGIVAVITASSKLVVANLGDSRCVAGEARGAAPKQDGWLSWKQRRRRP